MKRIIIILLLISKQGFCQTAEQLNLKVGDTVIVTNEAWNCGGITEEKAMVKMHNGYLCILFEFDPIQKPFYKKVKDALKYWKWQETTILRVKSKKII